MNYRFGIFLLWIALFVVLPTEAIRACSDDNIQNTRVYQTDDTHCDAEEDDCIEAHPGQDCPPDTDGCGHCHCPGCGAPSVTVNPGFFRSAFFEQSPVDWSYADRLTNFCYQEPLTSAHLSALFQPPRV